MFHIISEGEKLHSGINICRDSNAIFNIKVLFSVRCGYEGQKETVFDRETENLISGFPVMNICFRVRLRYRPKVKFFIGFTRWLSFNDKEVLCTLEKLEELGIKL